MLHIYNYFICNYKMEELTEFLGGVVVYTPEEEFMLIERNLNTPIEAWDERMIEETRKRYQRYLRNINFQANPEIEKDLQFFVDMTSNSREYNQFDTYRLARKIDFAIYVIIQQAN